MSAKYTKGALSVQDPLGPDILSLVADSHRQVYDWKLVAQIAVSDEGGENINPVEAKANAARLALCWNKFDELTEALRGLIAAPVLYNGNKIEIECMDHADAMRRVFKARALLADIDGAK